MQIMRYKHKYKIAALIVVGVFFAATAGMSMQASALEVDPQILDVSGEQGSFQIRTVTITNDDDEQVNVTVEFPPGMNYYLPVSHYTLAPHESKRIQMGVTVQNTTTSVITYKYNNETDYIPQMIRVNVSRDQPDIIMAPSSPSPGDGIHVMLMSDELINAQGMVICSKTDNRYPFTIERGIGTFKLNKSEKPGTAVMRLISNDFNPIFYSFNITGEAQDGDGDGDDEEEKELTIDIRGGDDVGYGASRIVSLSIDETSAEGSLIVTTPDGDQLLKKTDSEGRTSITFDTAGLWSLQAESGNYTAEKGIRIEKQNMSITRPQGDITTGEEITFTTSPNAECTITGGDRERNLVADASGELSWTPSIPGEYTLEATTEQKKGSISFIVTQNTQIRIDQRGATGGKIKKGVETTVKVVDSGGQRIETIDEITIRDPNNFPVRASLVDGMLQWTPDMTGVYNFEVTGTGNTMGDTAQVQVIDATTTDTDDGGFPWGGLIVIVIVIIALVLVVIRKINKERKTSKSTGEEAGGGKPVDTQKETVEKEKGLLQRFITWLSGGETDEPPHSLD